MSEIIKVKGLASGKSFKLEIKDQSELQMSLMHFLQSRNLPIASSCSGEGICEKCVVNNDLLSCQVSTLDALQLNTRGKHHIRIDYI